MKTEKSIIVEISELKQMQQKGFIGWSKYLLPYCQEYFDVGYSIAHIQNKLIEVHDLKVSSDTLNRLRVKYRSKKEIDNSDQTNSIPYSPVKSEISIEQKKVEEEKIQPSEEEVLKDLVDAYNNHRLSRTQRKDPLDDLIAKQQRDKLLREQQAPPNE